MVLEFRISKSVFLMSGWLIATFLLGCDTEKSPPSQKGSQKSQAEVENIEVLFDEGNFQDKDDAELLKELKICDEFQKDTNDYLRPACLPKFFRVFSLTDNLSKRDAFLVLVKSKVGGIKLRRILLFVRENGQLVKVNGFVANLTGIRKSKSHFYDLFLRFNDNVDGEIIFYNTIFTWDGLKYQFKTVETIDGETWRQRILPQYKDSISQDIYKTIQKNKMVL